MGKKRGALSVVSLEDACDEEDEALASRMGSATSSTSVISRPSAIKEPRRR